ncbi:sensor domain-containing protein [Evansella cellulosilytica]|uniref:Diguanylate cyclase/phosphodiesterase with PAS/PAC sensor(S) n=1 Tax=Evansella cellulosilytica (strain ATCC 21833 / DSM 2522 / FERM P-1141 / JCM 9156 / N-4) TaxID=649639 RepID=E6U0J7_EVAC2|nr:EAL domain-containing protein [Evansella cellulosilytica]ADU31442.1 diguanylate cyclase/phosphodiesterase with PAS/PAC sensor(s) [Evansella cellulosilytica DSM 2522]
MFQSLGTVSNWVNSFRENLMQEYENISDYSHSMLIQLEELLRAFDHSCILVLTDSSGSIIEVNDTYCQVSGYSRDELVGNTHRLVHSGYHTQEFYHKLWQTIMNGDIWSGEIKNRKKDGSIYWVKATIYPIYNKEGKIDMFLSIRLDITEGKIYEEKLRQIIEKDYSTIIKNIQNFIIRVLPSNDKGPVVSLLEGHLAKVIGIDTEKAKNKPIGEVIGNSRDKDIITSRFKQAFEGQKVEFDFKHGYRILHASITPIIHCNEVIEVIATINDITELKNSELAVKNMAYHDALTGLPNRRILEEDLMYRLVDAKTQQKKASLIIVDLDKFKYINDTLGHNVGDRFIMMAAERLQTLTFDNHVEYFRLYHLGGDEFAWIIIGPDEHVCIVTRQILTLFDEPFYYRNGEFHQKASIGVSVFPEHATNPEELMKAADMALLSAKHAGGNTFRKFNSQMKNVFVSKVLMEDDLRQAIIANNQFELFYQPVMDVKQQKINSCEALIRWYHPKKGLINPADFIPIAEETGLIIPLGEWVIRQACRDLKRWEESQIHLNISVNISAYQLKQSDFVERLTTIVSDERVLPNRIQLEITENGLMENTTDSINTLQKLKQIGFTIAIDDFGIGYSSLSYLKQFPVNCLKIDRSFVKDIPSDNSDSAIVSSVVKLGKDLGLLVVAEGVEGQEASDYLSSIECPYLQGYYYSKPIKFEDFTDLMNEHVM